MAEATLLDGSHLLAFLGGLGIGWLLRHILALYAERDDDLAGIELRRRLGDLPRPIRSVPPASGRFPIGRVVVPAPPTLHLYDRTINEGTEQ